MREVVEGKRSWVDRAGDGMTRFVSIFAPQLALKQQMARSAGAALHKFSAGGYRRGSGDRRDWPGWGGSPDGDNLWTLESRRQKSRDRYNNDPVAKAGVRAFVRDIGTGMTAQSVIDWEIAGISEERAIEESSRAEALFEMWASCKFCDIRQRTNFYQAQRVVKAGQKMNGDIITLVRRKPHPRRIVEVAFQLLEADRLSTPTDKASDSNIREGVHIDEDGAPLGYYLRKAHPGDVGIGAKISKAREWIYVPAVNEFGEPNVLLNYEVERPEQSRGVPTMSGILDYLHDHDRMMEAELMAQLLAASIGLIVKSGNPSALGRGSASGNTYANNRLEEIYPAMIEYINHDEEITTFNPERPGQTFEPFMRGVHRLLSLGFDLPVQTVFQMWDDLNYSGARTIKNEEARTFDPERADMGTDWCHPLYQAVMTACWRSGLWLQGIGPEQFFGARDAFLKATWTGPDRGFVDPDKEARASEKNLQKCTTTLQRECAARGMDWRDVLKQRAREYELMRELGIPVVYTEGTDDVAAAVEEAVAAEESGAD